MAAKIFRPVRFSAIILTNKAVNKPNYFIRKGTSKQRQLCSTYCLLKQYNFFIYKK